MEYLKLKHIIFFILVSFVQDCSLQPDTSAVTPANSNTPNTTTTTNIIPTHMASTTTTLSPEETCRQHNASCSDCLGVSGAKCLWCGTSSTCTLYPVRDVLPKKEICSLGDARWGVCWMNFEAMIISVSIIGGLIVLTIISCCVYCCCCRGRNTAKYDKEDARFETQKMDRKAKAEDRKAERKERLDEIRRKYGLVKEETPYQRFDA